MEPAKEAAKPPLNAPPEGDGGSLEQQTVGLGRSRHMQRGKILDKAVLPVSKPPVLSQFLAPAPVQRISTGIGKVKLEESNLHQFEDADEDKLKTAKNIDVSMLKTAKRASLRGFRGIEKKTPSPSPPPHSALNTKPKVDYSKQGKLGQIVPLSSNYFILQHEPGWALHQHRIDFIPMEDNERTRRALVKAGLEQLQLGYIFDGTLLYSPRNLGEQEIEVKNKAGEMVVVKIRHVNEMLDDMYIYNQFYNLTLRRCLFGMGLELIGRNFFDPEAAINIPQHKLTLWPGFITSMAKHEQNVMMGVEVSHKVIRSDTVLAIINGLRSNRDFKNAVDAELNNSIVLTNYNRKTYTLQSVEWNLSPKSTFDFRGTQTSYADYYSTKYDVKITDMDQPLLLALSRDKDRQAREMQKIRGNVPVYLVPEVCQLTGLSDAMRSNFTLMKDLAKYLHMDPTGRVEEIRGFMNRLLTTPKVVEELKRWDIAFKNEMVKVTGRVLSRERIVFAGPKPPEEVNDKADFTMAFRSRQMLKTKSLNKWFIIVPARDASNVGNLIQTMVKVANPLNFNIKPPLDIVKVDGFQVKAYTNALKIAYETHKDDLQLVFAILPNNKLELYSAVKKMLSIDYGVISQCFLAKNVTSKGLMSIATKVVIQINAKMGGEPWSVQMPLKKTMFVGFDVNRAARGSKAPGIGALVSTTSDSFASYFSTISYHKDLEEQSTVMANNMKKTILAYFEKNQDVPERIIFFRDGVGEGQLGHVFKVELEQVLDVIGAEYTQRGKDVPKFTFIIVTKKIDTRFFGQGLRNPVPGTVVDDVVTSPQSLDFFMVTTAARQGTVSPCRFDIIFDTQGLDMDKLERITYKMCHMYFNWSGTVAVPAPCQYAHKLAFLAGTALGSEPSPSLQYNLHYL